MLSFEPSTGQAKLNPVVPVQYRNIVHNPLPRSATAAISRRSTFFIAFSDLARKDSVRGNYSILGIGVDRKHAPKWLFPQEKAALHAD
jgi:hypothetical protein